MAVLPGRLLRPPILDVMVWSGDAWERQARRIADVCTEHLPVLTDVYVHGSAALGGFTDASDLDVLVVGEGAANWPALGSALLSAATDFPLELSVVAPRDAANPAPPWPFLLHVASPNSVVLPETSGDPDLCAHYAVTRRAGLPILGVPTEEAVGQISRDVLLAHLHDELTWGREHADQRYAVLNACRAEAYATDGVLLSKIDGGHWWTRRHGHEQLVQEALQAQALGRDLGTCTLRAREFVDRAAQALRRP